MRKIRLYGPEGMIAAWDIIEVRKWDEELRLITFLEYDGYPTKREIRIHYSEQHVLVVDGLAE